jgi:hypothetical protein
MIKVIFITLIIASLLLFIQDAQGACCEAQLWDSVTNQNTLLKTYTVQGKYYTPNEGNRIAVVASCNCLCNVYMTASGTTCGETDGTCYINDVNYDSGFFLTNEC